MRRLETLRGSCIINGNPGTQTSSERCLSMSQAIKSHSRGSALLRLLLLPQDVAATHEDAPTKTKVWNHRVSHCFCTLVTLINGSQQSPRGPRTSCKMHKPKHSQFHPYLHRVDFTKFWGNMVFIGFYCMPLLSSCAAVSREMFPLSLVLSVFQDFGFRRGCP